MRFLGAELELEVSVRFRFLAEGRVKNEDIVVVVRRECCEALEGTWELFSEAAPKIVSTIGKLYSAGGEGMDWD